MAKRAAAIIGQQLRKGREGADLSVAEASKVLSVRRQMVYDYEKGKSLPSLDVLIRAANTWNVVFELDGCKVLPKGIDLRKSRQPQPVQQALPFRRPRLFKKASVKIRQRDHEMVITAVVRNGL